MNIKRLLAGSLAAITAGATLAFGAFATDLGDYVATADGSLTSPTVVIGGSGASSDISAFAKDVLGAADIAAAMAGYATTTQTVSSAGGTASASNGWLITSDLNKTYLSGAFSDVKATLTSTNLPDLLASDSITDTNNAQTTVTQRLNLGSHSVDFGTPSGATEPYLYMNFSSSPTYTLEIQFTGGLNTSAINTNKDITLFGKEYTFGETVDNTTVTLYSKQGAATVTLAGVGDEETVSVDDTDYTLTLDGYSGTNTAFISVDGVTPDDYGWAQGSTYTVNGVRYYMSSVSVISTDATAATVTAKVFVGTDKLELFDGNTAVEVNDLSDGYSSVKSDFDIAGTKIHSINITVGPSTTTYVTDGNTFEDPLFGFKWKLDGMNIGLKDASRDHIQIAKDSTTKAKLTFTNKDDTTYSFVPHAYNTTASAWALSDGTYNFHVQENQTIALNSLFAVTDAGNKETYILKYSSYGTSATATSQYVNLVEQTTGTTFKVYLNSTDPYLRIGSSQYNVSWASYADPYSINVDLDGNGTISSLNYVNLYTKTGAVINPRDADYFNITETPLYSITGSNEPTGDVINISNSYSSTEYVSFGTPSLVSGTLYGGQVTTTTYRYMTDYSTYLEQDTTSDAVDIYYAGDRPAYALVAVGEDPSISVSGGSSTTYEEALKITAPVSMLASEVMSAYSDLSTLDKDLVLVGGPCANLLVAELMGDNACANWNYTEGIIKEFANAFSSGQKALVVAGNEAEDTRQLAADLISGAKAIGYSA